VQSITAQVLTKNNSFGNDEIQQSVTFSGDLRQSLEYILEVNVRQVAQEYQQRKQSFSQICYYGIDYIEFSQIFFRQKIEISTLTASIFKEASSDQLKLPLILNEIHLMT